MVCRISGLHGQSALKPLRAFRAYSTQAQHLRADLLPLDREWFRNIHEARVLIEQWRQFYNHRRPHSALGYKTPSQARQRWLSQDKIDVGLTA
jgi:transposase InsO family protein